MTSAQRRPLGLMLRALIDAGLNIYGVLQTDGAVEVDGKMVGNIGCTHLTIGKGAPVTGNIRADEVLVRGKVKGTIRATRVILQDSAQVEGDIYHDRIVIGRRSIRRRVQQQNGDDRNDRQSCRTWQQKSQRTEPCTQWQS